MKCVFGILADRFLGFMLAQEGIEANPEQCKIILDMRSPSNLKEVQRLNRQVASLSRFMSRSAHNSITLYRLLKRGKDFT